MSNSLISTINSFSSEYIKCINTLKEDNIKLNNQLNNMTENYLRLQEDYYKLNYQHNEIKKAYNESENELKLLKQELDKLESEKDSLINDVNKQLKHSLNNVLSASKENLLNDELSSNVSEDELQQPLPNNNDGLTELVPDYGLKPLEFDLINIIANTFDIK